jgi:hypothetical protein
MNELTNKKSPGDTKGLIVLEMKKIAAIALRMPRIYTCDLYL